MSLADLVHIERGLAADRPSSPVGKRRGWYATDTDVLSIHDGTGWNDIGGGSGDVATDSIWDTKGDLAAATGADAAVKVTVGSDGKVLTADSGATPGVSWQTPKTVATDAIWDAAGDIAVATGADAAAKLALGSSGKVLKSNGSTAVWDTPPGYEIDYAEITSSVTITATSAATATTCITGASVSYDGSTVILIEFLTYGISFTADNFVVVNLYDGSTDLGRLAAISLAASGATTVDGQQPVFGARRLTPSNASHQYSIRTWKSGGTTSFVAGAGGTDTVLPAFMRITKV